MPPGAPGFTSLWLAGLTFELLTRAARVFVMANRYARFMPQALEQRDLPGTREEWH